MSRPLRPPILTDHRGIRPSEVGDPVRLPGLVVIRKRLAPPGMVMIDFVPLVPYFHRPVIVLVLRVEFAAVALESSNDRDRVERSSRAVDPVDRPLVLANVEGSQCE